MTKKDCEETAKSKASSFGRVIKQKRIEDLGAGDGGGDDTPSKKKIKSHSSKSEMSGAVSAANATGRARGSTGDWKASDDKELVAAMSALQGNYQAVNRQITFSFKATVKDIEARWIHLLYSQKDPSDTSATAVVQVTAEPSTIANNENTNPNSNTTNATDAIDPNNANGREVNDMNLSNQEHLPLEAELAEAPPLLNDVEASLFNVEGLSDLDECLSPMQQANRSREYGRVEKLAQREILKVEKEYARDRDSLRERDTKMLATVRGSRLRYTVRTKEVLLGRPDPRHPVDINVLEEGAEGAHKCSRRQAIIKMKRDGEFYIKNIGKRVLYPLK